MIIQSGGGGGSDESLPVRAICIFLLGAISPPLPNDSVDLWLCPSYRGALAGRMAHRLPFIHGQLRYK